MQPASESAAPRDDQDVAPSPDTNQMAPVQRAWRAADSIAVVPGGSTFGDGIAGIAVSTDVAHRSSRRRVRRGGARVTSARPELLR